MSNLLSLNLTEVKSAIVYALLTALLQICIYIAGVGSIFKVEWHTLVDIGVIALIVGFISIIKNLLTTSDGKFLGAIKVK